MQKFARYKNPNLSNYERFIAPDEASTAWGKEYLRLMSQPRGLLRDIAVARHLGLTKRDVFGHDIYKFTSVFTIDKHDDDYISDLLSFIVGKHPNRIKHAKRVGKESFEFLLSDGSYIWGRTLSEICPNLYKDHPELTTDKRKGKCHDMSMALVGTLGSPEARIATGPIWSLSPKSTILHSWVEDKVNGDEVVFDFTLNIMMNKDGYYKIMHISEPFERISNEELMADIQILARASEIDPEIDGKLYLSSREEAMEKARAVLIESVRSSGG